MPKDRWWQRSPLILVLLLLLWSLALGWGLAEVTSGTPRLDTPSLASAGGLTPPISSSPAPPLLTQASSISPVGGIDPVPPGLQLGQEVYLQTCATCHLGLPPAVLPTETWRQIIQDSQHYSVQLKPLVDPTRLLVWNYLRTFSRPQLAEEDLPYRVDNSRFFRALHPTVKIARPVRMNSCVACHPGAPQYDYRSLTPEWENAP
ncbi:cytochrome C [Neosynechococcus sphagnicola sy1]|uniref:Cytochrome C n=1 Tax=Neosynechococcus sphagnicola sy1 TaxID=1497020 RepID=A0A098TN22_9CYAN|nr:cytochrome C [Neosynechococcus sphagnicola sy1]